MRCYIVKWLLGNNSPRQGPINAVGDFPTVCIGLRRGTTNYGFIVMFGNNVKR